MNIDIASLFSKAFRITFKHRSLWVLGFLIALANGGSGTSFNFNSSFPSGGGSSSGTPSLPPEIEQAFDRIGTLFQDNSGLIFAVIGAVFCILLVLGLIFMILGEIGQGGLIHSVNSIEEGLPATLGDGWRAGRSRLKSLVGQRLLLALPAIIIIAIIFGILAVTILPAAMSGSSGSAVGDTAVAGIFAGLCFLVPLYCVFLIYSIIAGILGVFGRRAVMLDGLSAMDGLRTGWQVFRNNLTNAFVIGLLWWIISIVVSVVLGILSLIALAPLFVGGLAAFSGGESLQPGLIALGVVLIFVLFVVGMFASSVLAVLSSSVFTLMYRLFRQAPTLAAPVVGNQL
jgi:hypothetical protein